MFFDPSTSKYVQPAFAANISHPKCIFRGNFEKPLDAFLNRDSLADSGSNRSSPRPHALPPILRTPQTGRQIFFDSIAGYAEYFCRYFLDADNLKIFNFGALFSSGPSGSCCLSSCYQIKAKEILARHLEFLVKDVYPEMIDGQQVCWWDNIATLNTSE